MVYLLRFIHDVFFNGEPIDLLNYLLHEFPCYMKVLVEVLVFFCLLVGVVLVYIVALLLVIAVVSILGGELFEYSLAIWHGFNLLLMMSFIVLFGGIFVYFCRRLLFCWYEGLFNLDVKEVFDQVVRYMICLFVCIIKLLESGSL